LQLIIFGGCCSSNSHSTFGHVQIPPLCLKKKKRMATIHKEQRRNSVNHGSGSSGSYSSGSYSSGCEF
jgi:hypothetical protein